MKLFLHGQPYTLGPSVLALGMFDGLHLGHRRLLEKAASAALRECLSFSVVSFVKHPMAVLETESAPMLLTTNTEKARMLNAAGVDGLVYLRFDRDFASLSAEEYLRFLKEKYVARHLVMGENHRFGKNGSGNAEAAKKIAERLQLKLTVVPAEMLDGKSISSTRIRQALQAGDLAGAQEMLGYLYSLKGEIVHGQGLGRSFGFPTINVAVPKDKLLPRFGVYGALVRVENRVHRAVCNIGVRPTVGAGEPSVEAFLLDFEGDIYGKHATVALVDFYRPEMHFSSIEDLAAQVKRDAARAMRELPLPF